MADNFQVNQPTSSGDVFAADDIAGVKHQRVKAQFGPDGSATDVSVAAPLPSDLVLEDPKSAAPSAVAVAAGASVDLDSDQIASGKTGRLVFAEFGSTVATKAELFAVVNGTPGAVLARGLAWAGRMHRLKPASRQVWTVAESATAGFDGFRLTVTNLDNAQAADLYANLQWDER